MDKSNIEEQLKKNSKQSYSDFIKAAKRNAETALADRSAQINAEELKNKLSNGALANRLNLRGLNASGYSDYLKSQDEKTRSADKSEAEGEYFKSLSRAASSYADYVNNYKTLQLAAEKSYLSSLIKDGVFNPEEAYRRAVGSGLSPESALYAASYGAKLARARASQNALSHIKQYNYTEEMARKYARSLGLPETDVEHIAAASRKLSDAEIDIYSHISPKEYFDLLNDGTITEKKNEKTPLTP